MSCCEEKKFQPFTQHSLLNAGVSVIKHILDPNYNAFVEKEIKDERLKACNSCEMNEMFLGKKRCKVCSCFTDAKSSLLDQDCPHPGGSKWQRSSK
jgi:protein-arginine kinase activator protein McsA